MNDIIMICDNNYVLPTVVAITSLQRIEDDDRKYDVHILADELTVENKNKIASLQKDNITIIMHDVNSKQFSGAEKKYSSVSRSALLKFAIPQIVDSVSRALYIDGDVIFCHGISSIFDIELGSCYAAVVKDGPKDYVVGGKKHWFYGSKDYFNSGVMYLNLDKLRQDCVSEKLLKYRKNEYNYFMDQDAFNMVFGQNVIYMGVENDFMLHLISYRNKNYSLQQLKEFYGTKEYSCLDELFCSVNIIHYTFDKPWKYYDIAFAEKWMKNFNCSPCKDQKLERHSFLTVMYNSKAYKIGRKISSFIRFFLPKSK